MNDTKVTNQWWGGRNTYLAEWGEYEPTSGFSFERTLFRSAVTEWAPMIPRLAVAVVAKLSVSELWRGERRRVHSFSLRVEPYPGQYRHIEVTRGRCQSVAEAIRRADTALYENDHVREALRLLYSERREVYTLEGQHVATLFCQDYQNLLKYGDFLVFDPDGYRWHVRVDGSGYSASSLPNGPIRMMAASP